jgi:hypothetical protein
LLNSVLKMLSVWLNKYLERDFFFHDRGNRLFDQLLKFLKVIQERDHSEQANKLKLLILKVSLAFYVEPHGAVACYCSA